MQTGHSFTRLSEELSENFSVYTPDRRGRGLSGSAREDHDIAAERADISALVLQTGAEFLFGLSSGAVVCLHAALALPSISKIALYEPPLLASSSDSSATWPSRYRDEVADRRMTSAFVTAMLGTDTAPRALRRLPRLALVPLMKVLMELDALAARGGGGGQGSRDRRGGRGGRVPLKALVPTMLLDMRVGLPEPVTAEMFHDLRARVLLCGGSRSPRYVKDSLALLERLIPGSARTELAGLDHLSPASGAQAATVAAALTRFFADCR